jgi:hypothetical protein
MIQVGCNLLKNKIAAGLNFLLGMLKKNQMIFELLVVS